MGASILPLYLQSVLLNRMRQLSKGLFMLELNVEPLALALCASFPFLPPPPSSYAYLFTVFSRQDLMEPRLSSDSLFNGD